MRFTCWFSQKGKKKKKGSIYKRNRTQETEWFRDVAKNQWIQCFYNTGPCSIHIGIGIKTEAGYNLASDIIYKWIRKFLFSTCMLDLRVENVAFTKTLFALWGCKARQVLNKTMSTLANVFCDKPECQYRIIVNAIGFGVRNIKSLFFKSWLQ